MSMRIAHLADVHLDRPFASLPGGKGERARSRLREAFCRCVNVARDRDADLITIGGDLWEDENVRIDTRRFVAHQLERAERPVLIICGNHDPYTPGGNYQRTEWPENVTVFDGSELTERTFEGVSVWGVSWTGGRLDAGFLDRFAPPGDGRHVLLVHGTSQPVAYFAEQSEHCPFDPHAVTRAGFDLCLAGHIHRASHRHGVVYPGSPEPLGWGETGDHCVAVIDVADSIEVELVPVNEHRYEEATVDCAGCESSAEIEERLHAGIAGKRGEDVHLRVTLEGEIDEHCVVAPSLLADAPSEGFAELIVSDSTHPAFDLDHLERQETVRGLFVADLRERVRSTGDERERERLERALHAGLRALAGREDVIGVD